MEGIDNDKLQRSIEMRREFHIRPEADDEIQSRSIKSFEHFLLIGVPPDCEPGKEKPKVLILFPYFPLMIPTGEFDQVIDFAFPTGLLKTEVATDKQPVILDEFTFCFKKERGTMYGTCVHFRVRDDTQSFFLSEANKGYVFCLCLLTYETCLASHFQFLTFLTKNIVGWEISVDDDIASITRIEVPKGEKPEFLENMTKLSNYARWKSMKFYRGFANNVQLYYKLERLDKSFICKPLKLTFPGKSVSPSMSVGCATMDTLFSHFSPSEIIRIYTATILEHHVIVVSDTISRVSNVVLALRCLLNPLKIQAQINPVLPMKESYLQILECPSPILLGLVRSPLISFDHVMEPKCIVDVDAETVKDTDLDLLFPGEKILENNIWECLSTYNKIISVPEKIIKRDGKKFMNSKWKKFFESLNEYVMPAHFLSQTNQKYAFNRGIVEKILSFFAESLPVILEEKVVSCIVTEVTDPTNAISVFNQDMFRTVSIGKGEEKFYEKLLEASIFFNFVERKLDKKSYIASISSGEPTSKSPEELYKEHFQHQESSLD